MDTSTYNRNKPAGSKCHHVAQLFTLFNVYKFVTNFLWIFRPSGDSNSSAIKLAVLRCRLWSPWT